MIFKNILFLSLTLSSVINRWVSAQNDSAIGTMEIIKRKIMSSLTLDGIITDVIDSVPINKIKVNYSGIEVNFGNELTPTQVKEQPLVDWPIEPNTTYTLVMTDPDAPSRENCHPKPRDCHGQVKHWLVINIPGTHISRGYPLAEYMASGPRKDTGLHRYTFLVYKQPNIINTTEKTVRSLSRIRREHFKVRDFAKQYNLGQPVAINYFLSQFDDWVNTFHSLFVE